MPNHAHLLLQTGRVPVATAMRRLLTWHAVAFTRRHQRHEHPFQNRYKSILVEEKPDLLEPRGWAAAPGLPRALILPDSG